MKIPTIRLILMLSLINFAGFSHAQDNVQIVQNSALKIGDQIIHLKGIVIPKPTDKCNANGKEWPCGAAATLRLNKLINESSLECESESSSNEVLLASCWNNEGDIAEQMVREGWALVVASSQEYISQEQIARNANVGIWKNGFLPPDNWRQYPDLTINPVLDLLCSSCAARKQQK